MPKKIVDFLKELIQKAGGQTESEVIKPLLEAPELNQLQVMLPDELTTVIDNGLLSLSAAKNNHPEIKGHYTAQVYNGVDAEMKSLMDEIKLPDADRAIVEAERSSNKKIGLIVRKVQELEATKAHAGKGATEALNTQITQLNNDLRAEKEKINGIKNEYETKLREKDMVYALRNLQLKYKTIYDELDADIKDMTLRQVLNKNLSKINAKLMVDEQGNLILQKNDGSNVFSDDNRLMTPEMFMDKTFADAKILKVNDQNQSGGGNNNTRTNGQQQQTGNNRQQNTNGAGGQQQQQNAPRDTSPNTSLKSLIKDSIKDMETSVNPVGGSMS